jgi:hypothetical protein
MADLVLSFSAFANWLLKNKREDFVYVRVLKANAVKQKHTRADWLALLNTLRSLPVTRPTVVALSMAKR